jgi:hypothetical protein
MRYPTTPMGPVGPAGCSGDDPLGNTYWYQGTYSSSKTVLKKVAQLAKTKKRAEEGSEEMPSMNFGGHALAVSESGGHTIF